jgi:DNA repair protein RadC
MLKQKMSIPMWAEDDRPVEKMLLKGKNALSDAELLAILIGTGHASEQKSAVDLGRELLQLCNGDLYEFGKLRIQQLCAIKGIGTIKAVKLLAALELGRRRKDAGTAKRMKIISSADGYHLIKSFYTDLQHEEFYIILLNQASELIGIRQISVGGMSGTYVDPKIIFKISIETGASGIVLTHNHPSGLCKPSFKDEELTRRIKHFGKLIEMPVLDHLIITDNGYFSFSDNGLLR